MSTETRTPLRRVVAVTFTRNVTRRGRFFREGVKPGDEDFDMRKR